MKTEDKIKEVMKLVHEYSKYERWYYEALNVDADVRNAAYQFTLVLDALQNKLRELLTPAELSDEYIKNIDDNTHFHESPDWSVRFARNILKAAGVQ